MSTGGRAPRKLTKEEEEERKETCKRLAKEREQRMIILAAARKAKREATNVPAAAEAAAAAAAAAAAITMASKRSATSTGDARFDYQLFDPASRSRFSGWWWGEAYEPQAIMLRGHSLREDEVPLSVRAVATCGEDPSAIDVEALTRRGIPVFSTPGSNANAVKELTLCGLLLAARDERAQPLHVVGISRAVVELL